MNSRKRCRYVAISFDRQKISTSPFFRTSLPIKIAKAFWVKNNLENVPPKTHNLLKIIKESNLELPIELQAFLIKLNQYQIESRYSDDIDKLYNITNKELTDEYFSKILIIEKCLKEQMQ